MLFIISSKLLLFYKNTIYDKCYILYILYNLYTHMYLYIIYIFLSEKGHIQRAKLLFPL